MKTKNLLLLALLSGASWTSAVADDVYTIYPVPQEQVAVSGTAAITADRIQVVLGADIDTYTASRIYNILAERGLATDSASLFVGADAVADNYAHIYVGVNGSGDAADQSVTSLSLSRDVFDLSDKYDKHILHIAAASDGNAEITLLGENTDAAFIGMASIEQILDAAMTSSGTKSFPCGTIYDYADQKNRGIVEGYYGVPYSAEVKADLMRFMMRYKMNSYMYGAKSDPYHSTYWEDPYPTTITDEQRELGYLSQSMLKELTNVSHATKVNFIWAIHPGNDFLGSTTVVNSIMTKYRLMYNLGIRQFAIFVDDVSIPSTDEEYTLNATRVTEVQEAIEALWNVDGAAPADTVKPLQFVPQIYCSSFSSGAAQRKAFFTALSATPSNVAIYTTGWGVWSVPNSDDVEEVRQYLGRDVAWWWNYPCNDNDANKLFPMDMYSNFSDESKITSSSRVDNNLQNCLGVLSNPMQQGEVAKVALFGIADYAWNNDAFDNDANWEAAFPAILSDSVAAAAFHTLAPYLRYYDSDALSSLITKYKASLSGGLPASDELIARMQTIVDAANVMQSLAESETESDRLLLNDLSPWLLKLKSMAEQVIALVTAADADDEAEKWNTYASTITPISVLSSADEFFAPQLAGTVGSTLSLSTTEAMPAQEALRPFITYMQDAALGNLLTSESTPTKATFISNLTDASGAVSTLRGAVTFRGVSNVMSQGDYIGVKLPQPIMPSAVSIADTLLANYTVLYSANGKDWHHFNTDSILSSYVRYVVFMNDEETPRLLALTRASFSLSMPVETTVSSYTIPSGSIYDSHTADLMVDGDYTTYTCLNRNQQSGDAYTVDLGSITTIGDVRICMGTVNGDYMNYGRVQISTDGTKWTNLKVSGTSLTTFRMSLPQVVKYSDEMSYCDFDGAGDSARYVRLYLSSPNTSRWLRLYEIEVNRQTYANSFASPSQDMSDEDKPVYLTTLSDGIGYTGTDSISQLGYTFYDLHDVESLKVFQSVDGEGAATVSITTDGTTWTEIATLTGGLQTLDLTPYPGARALSITWEKADAPVIYEIMEVLSSTDSPVISGIKNASVNPSCSTGASIALTQSGHNLKLTSAVGLQTVRVYTTEGKQLLVHNCGGSITTTVPILRSDDTLLIKVTQTDGQTVTFKVQGE